MAWTGNKAKPIELLRTYELLEEVSRRNLGVFEVQEHLELKSLRLRLPHTYLFIYLIYLYI